MRKPPWIRSKIPGGETYSEILAVKNKYNLRTVCEEARCPNHAHCWAQKHATFMILGNRCTRSCLFCSVDKTNRLIPVDEAEPLRIAQAVTELGIKYCVITSVTRDDIIDGGAMIFARTVDEIRKKNPGLLIELLIPDFKANEKSVKIVTEVLPYVLGHNIETSRRMHKLVRRGSDYDISLKVLKTIKQINPELKTKSSFLVGLGETDDEIHEMIQDLKNAGTDIIAIGQYLKPSMKSAEVARYVEPDQFKKFEEYALSVGINKVMSGPFVRSSYI